MSQPFQHQAESSHLFQSILDQFIEEPAEVYHENGKQYLGSHALGNFRNSPLLYHKKQSGLLPDEDRPAYLVGRAAHTLILEGRDEYERQFAVGGPINPKTQKVYGSNTSAFAKWAALQNKPVLTEKQAALIHQMADGVAQHEIATEMLSRGRAEGVIRAKYCGADCQIRVDWFNPELGIVDLKTCDDLTWFEADARRYGYAHQLAFYRSLMHRVSQKTVPVYLIAIEKKEPFRCGVWRVGQDVLGIAQQENEKAIERLNLCQENAHWPTLYEEIRIFDML